MSNQSTISATDVELQQLAAPGVGAVLWLAALVLLCRAAAGELTRFPTPLAAGALSVVAFAIGVGVWTWDERRRRTADLRGRVSRGLAAAAAPLIIGLTSAGSNAVLLGLTIAMVLLSGVWVVWSSLRRFHESADSPVAARPDDNHSADSRLMTPGDAEAAAGMSGAPNHENNGAHDETGSLIEDPAVTQQIVRRAAESPGDSIEALWRVRFEAGVREAVIQLPIHPPLAGQPQVECEPLDSTDLACTVTAARRFGVRIEVRRPVPCDQPLTALVGVEIHAASPAEAAA